MPAKGWSLRFFNLFRFVRRWQEHLVNDVDDAVAGHHVGRGTLASLMETDSPSTAKVTLSPLSMVATSPSVTFAASTAPSKTESRMSAASRFLHRCQRSKGQCLRRKGLVGRGKHRERTITSERCGEVHMVERRHQRVMHACSSGVGGDVLGSVSGDAEREGGKTQAGNK